MEKILSGYFRAFAFSICAVVGIGTSATEAFTAEHFEHSGSRETGQACENLISIKLFALGGVGYAGSISEGEKCFRLLTGATNGLAMFKMVLTNGTPEAQMYALAGIRLMAPKDFDDCAAPVIAANKNVNEMEACFASVETASNVVSKIRSGSYDIFMQRGQNKRELPKQKK